MEKAQEGGGGGSRRSGHHAGRDPAQNFRSWGWRLAAGGGGGRGVRSMPRPICRRHRWGRRARGREAGCSETGCAGSPPSAFPPSGSSMQPAARRRHWGPAPLPVRNARHSSPCRGKGAGLSSGAAASAWGRGEVKKVWGESEAPGGSATGCFRGRARSSRLSQIPPPAPPQPASQPRRPFDCRLFIAHTNLRGPRPQQKGVQ